MDHNVQGQVNALVRHITHFEKDSNPQVDKEFIAKNKPWNPVHLFTKVFQAIDEPIVMLAHNLEGLINQYNQENNTTLTLDWFYQKHWIRVIFNIVELPPAISYAVHSFDGVKDNLPELRFLLWIINNRGRKINKGDFEIAFQDYQLKNHVTLDLKGDYLKNYVSEEDGKMEFSNPMYFEKFISCEEEFRFLSLLKGNFKDGNQPVVTINTLDLQRIVNSHAVEYHGTPTYNEFISEGIFQQIEDKTALHLNEYWRYFGNEIISALWFKISPVDKVRFRRWLYVLFSQSWSQSAELYLPVEEKNILLKLLFDLIIEDPDFEPLSEEINKARLDSERDLMRLNPELFHELGYEISLNDTYYERCYKTDKITHESHSNLLIIQEARQNAFRLIRLLIVNDGHFNDTHLFFTRKLIEQGRIKPFLSFAACEVILNNRYNVLPYLLAEPPFNRLALYLLSQVEAPSSLTAFDSDEIQEKANHLSYLWDAGFEIFIKGLSRELLKYPMDIESVSEIIAEYLTLAFRLRYSNDRGWKYNKIFRQSDSQLLNVEKVGQLILSSGANFKMLASLSEKVTQQDIPVSKNNVVVIPLGHIHLQLTTLKWVEKAALSNTDCKQALSKGIDKLSILINNCFRDEMYNSSPHALWRQQPDLELLPWHDIVEFYSSHELLEQLLVVPVLKLDLDGSKDNLDSIRLKQKNRYQTDRARTYFIVISKMLRGTRELRSGGNIISKLEQFYFRFLKDLTYDDLSNNKVNILHQSLDSNYGLRTLRLLPEVIHDLNSFSDVDVRKDIISLLAERLAFQQVVEIWHNLSSEGDKELLRSVILKRGLDSLFAESRWMPDFEMTLRILAWGNMFSTELDDFVNKLTDRSKKKTDGLLFHLKLYQFYHKADIESIRTLNPPDKPANGLTQDDYNAEKQLFEAILLINKKEFKRASNILRNLSQRRRRFVFSLNQFICFIKEAECELIPTTKRNLYEKAVQFWDEELKQLQGEEASSLQSTALYYQLLAYHILERHNDFDAAYGTLTQAEKMISDFLLLRVKDLLKRSRESEANDLYRAATQYHSAFEINRPAILDEINTLLTSPAQLNRLASYYLQILDQRPEEIIKIVPASINPNRENLIDFISYEVEYCLLELIKRVRSLSETSKETKYNDLLASMLQARIVMYNWVVKDNSTGNKSGGGTEPGERDLIIAHNHIDISVLECLHIFNRTDQFIHDHIAKVFTYSQSKMPKFIIGYYRGVTDDFVSTWKYYKETLFPTTVFEPLYKPVKLSIDEIATNSDGLLKGKSYHGDGHELIHIFINLNLTA